MTPEQLRKQIDIRYNELGEEKSYQKAKKIRVQIVALEEQLEKQIRLDIRLAPHEVKYKRRAPLTW